MSVDTLLAIVASFLGSFQVRVILGLVFLDVVLGVASALKRKQFDLTQLADFYRSNVLPYLVGYGAVYVAVYAVFPADAKMLPDGLVTVAWAALIGTLSGSVLSHVWVLYPNPLVEKTLGRMGMGWVTAPSPVLEMEKR